MYSIKYGICGSLAVFSVLLFAPNCGLSDNFRGKAADIKTPDKTSQEDVFLQTWFLSDEGMKYGITSLNGEEIIPSIYDSISGDINNDESEDSGARIVAVKQNGKYGYINLEGGMITDLIFSDGGRFYGDYACVATNDTYGVIDKSGNFVIDPTYENIRPLGSIGDKGYFSVKNDSGGWDILNTDDKKTEFEDAYTSITRFETDFWTDDYNAQKRDLDYFIAKRTGEDGESLTDIYDKNLQLLAENVVSVVSNSGYTVLTYKDQEGAYSCIVDSRFRPVIEEKFDWIEMDDYRPQKLKNFMAPKDGAINLYSIKGKELYKFDSSFQHVEPIDDYYQVAAATNEDGFIELLDYRGNSLCDDLFDAVDECYLMEGDSYDGYLTVSIHGKTGIFDCDSKKLVVPCMYSSITPLGEDVFLIIQNDDYYVVDCDGRKILSGFCDVICPGYLSNGSISLAPMYGDADELLGVYDIQGNQILPEEYNAISAVYTGDVEETLFIVEKDGKYGAANYLGELVIPVEYDFLSEAFDLNFEMVDSDELLLQATKGSQYGFINNQNQWVISYSKEKGK